MSIRISPDSSIKSNSIDRDQLPTQNQLDNLEIRFTNCVITYKLKHIETQASKYRWRKIGKSFGYSFPPLRKTFENDVQQLFQNCIFNPSDKWIVKEHLKNFECPKIRFINCKFLRRDSRLEEKIVRIWRKQRGEILKYSGQKGFVNVGDEIVRLKDLPLSIEFIIQHGKEVIESSSRDSRPIS